MSIFVTIYCVSVALDVCLLSEFPASINMDEAHNSLKLHSSLECLGQRTLGSHNPYKLAFGHFSIPSNIHIHSDVVNNYAQ